MASGFCDLARVALSTPGADFPLHTRPEESCGSGFYRGARPGMGKRVDGVENWAAEIRRYEWAWPTFRNVTEKRDRLWAHSHSLETEGRLAIEKLCEIGRNGLRGRHGFVINLRKRREGVDGAGESVRYTIIRALDVSNIRSVLADEGERASLARRMAVSLEVKGKGQRLMIRPDRERSALKEMVEVLDAGFNGEQFPVICAII